MLHACNMTLSMLGTCNKTCMLHLHDVKHLSVVGLAVGIIILRLRGPK